MHNFPQESDEAELLAANSRSITSALSLDITMKKVKWKGTSSIMEHSLPACQNRRPRRRGHPHKELEVGTTLSSTSRLPAGFRQPWSGVMITRRLFLSQTCRCFAAPKLRRKRGDRKVLPPSTAPTPFPHRRSTDGQLLPVSSTRSSPPSENPIAL